MTAIPFPNSTQMRQVLPVRVWHVLRAGAVLFALSVIALLVARPSAGLKLWWGFIVPVLPLVFFAAPGLWRNLCPMAALNQTPRLFGFTRGLALPAWLKEYGYVIGIALFLVIVPSRKVLFNDNGPALAALLVAALAAAILGGLMFKGKGGWCSSGVCPLFPVQRIYGQTPFVVIPNSHCQPCVGCAKNCYDFNPRVAYLADMNDEDPRYTGYRTFFAGAFPGVVIAFYNVASPPAISAARMYAEFALYVLASAGLFYALDRFAKLTTAKITAVFAVAAFNLYYWYNIPLMSRRVLDAEPAALVWAGRGAILALTAVWLWRTYQKERVYLAQTAATRAPRLAGGASIALRGSVALRQGQRLGAPEVTFQPAGKRVVATNGRTLLELAEANNQKLESGCRMGVCGADPIAVLAGMDRLSPVSDDERNTLERLGYAGNTRMACMARVQGDCTIALKPERPSAFSSSVLRGFPRDPTVSRVVIIGNGIAGVTAADHVRRRHPGAEILVIAREKHHLYNRMGIERLVYGRSAMSGLYLQEERWYEDLGITTWLNTHVAAIDRDAKQVRLGTGETAPYDRLILATGSSATMPRIEGAPCPGVFVMREADDALAIRAYAQQHGCQFGAIAGGGLLGLEAAYALHKLGLKVTVLERSEWLLRRQVDQRGSGYLRAYLEGLGLEILTNAETASVQGEDRLRRLTLKDGRTLPCDLLVVAAGITPNVDLARAAGLQVNRGVVVDDALRTSDPAIFAVGDVAEYRGVVAGLWPAASEQAQIAAANALGDSKTYEPAPAATALKIVGVELTSIGRIDARGPDDVVVALEESDANRYRKLVIADGRIAGAILFGYPQLSPVVSAAIKNNVDVSGVITALRAGNWDILSTLKAGAPPLPPAAAAVPVLVPPAPSPPGPVATPLTPAVAAPSAGPPAAGAGSGERRRPVVRLMLRGVQGAVKDLTHAIGPSTITLGRTADSTVVIPDEKLSRRHAGIEYREGGFWVSDLGSLNGTYVNYQPLTTAHRLETGDVLMLGDCRLVVELQYEAP